MKEKVVIPFDLRAAGVPAVDWSKVDVDKTRRPPRYPAEVKGKGATFYRLAEAIFYGLDPRRAYDQGDCDANGMGGTVRVQHSSEGSGDGSSRK